MVSVREPPLSPLGGLGGCEGQVVTGRLSQGPVPLPPPPPQAYLQQKVKIPVKDTKAWKTVKERFHGAAPTPAGAVWKPLGSSALLRPGGPESACAKRPGTGWHCLAGGGHFGEGSDCYRILGVPPNQDKRLNLDGGIGPSLQAG